MIIECKLRNACLLGRGMDRLNWCIVPRDPEKQAAHAIPITDKESRSIFVGIFLHGSRFEGWPVDDYAVGNVFTAVP